MAAPDKLMIWTNRLTKEFEEMPNILPPCITQLVHNMDNNEGFCRAQFRILVEEDPDLAGPDGVQPGEEQEVIVELDFNQAKTNYPFGPPIIKALKGAEFVPPSNLRRDNTITMPELDAWTPSQTSLVLILTLRELIITGGPLPGSDGSTSAEGGMTSTFTPGQLINLDLFEGTIFPCRVKGQGVVINRYLGLSEAWCLEVEAHRTRVNWVAVVKAQELQQIQKLKFKRNVSITLIFKDEEVWEFEMEESGECVNAIQDQLSRQGIQGRKTTMAAAQQLERARDIVAEAERKGRELSECPTLERVQEIMDMYREATEKFAAVSNEKHQEVVAQLHAFIQRPDVMHILETQHPPPAPPVSTPSSSISFASPPGSRGGSFSFPAMPKVMSQFLKGEVLFRSEADDDDDDGLAREERNLAKYGIAQLKKFMDLSLETGELRTPSTFGSTSSAMDDHAAQAQAQQTPASASRASPFPPSFGEERRTGVSGGAASTPLSVSSDDINLGGSIDSAGGVDKENSSSDGNTAIADEFQGLLGQATREFERLNSNAEPVKLEEGEAENGSKYDCGGEGAAIRPPGVTSVGSEDEICI